ncbi:uncharacterized protein Z520_00884 [Fonsecaea multimorphosa CBS 102226]|uniref:C2H2-type domain-containing protein n=1 Tax=Fonsecaea multimorphosa CBS 102226 TaxID=1442371 RepID=A0A0D2HQR6_9EURO|nr:uncharacterized protein Z520_00884 [Fonsecaea multimorphosa CBS 102226]KIY04191.1 hypothetical protein Z520_00884 [Fonsecaea multimorphosa CBS 102226]OAL32020.1 hypothetical protein AYO22_00890 [Fonsecaea multimorphosa]
MPWSENKDNTDDGYIDTRERPFACECGQAFTRKDLLSRHLRLSHSQLSDVLSGRDEEDHPEPSRLHTDETTGDDPDLLFDPQLFMQDILPPNLFDLDANFPLPSAQTRPPSPGSNDFPRFSSRLPDLDRAERERNTDEDHSGAFSDYTTITPWSFSESAYEGFCLEVESYSAVLPHDWHVPSRNALSRNLESYFRCAQENLPFLHSATFSVAKTDVELLLAAAAMGALNRFETSCSYCLYNMAKAILLENLRRQDLELSTLMLPGQDHATLQRRNGLGKIQSLILLVAYASWAGKDILPDAISLGGRLSVLVRQHGLSEMHDSTHVDGELMDVAERKGAWCEWVTAEERRRTLLSAYVLLSLHSIAYDIPPQLLNRDMGVLLPSCVEPWKATNPTQWHRSNVYPQCLFQQAFRSLFDGNVSPVSSFANYVLIHSLLQEISIWNGDVTVGRLAKPETANAFETALRTWQSSWELTHESTLDPLSEKGPLGLNATALLRLAYIRLSSNLAPCRALLTRDISNLVVQRTWMKSPSAQVDRAVLHAAHALSIPVRLGIELVTHTRLPFRGIENSLSSLECALLLRDWLVMVATITRSCGPDALRKTERKLLDIVSGIIKETSLADTLDVQEDDSSRYQRMATTILRLWAQIFQGVHVLEIDRFIGSGLRLLADAA